MKMRVVRSLILFLITLGFASSCFDPPEFSNIPKITFQDIYFGDDAEVGEMDSLVITIKFKDGDGDLGLAGNENQYPFHNYDFFVDRDGELFNVNDLERPEPGMKLTRKRSYQMGINGMHPFEPPYDCMNYVKDTLFVPESWESIIDDSYQSTPIEIDGTVYFRVTDTLYVVPNPRSYNIDVVFLKKGPTDPEFVEYNWPLQGSQWPECPEGFNGRFPLIAKDKDTPMEGTISYAMQATGFRQHLGTALIRLKVKIRDRSGNESNEIITPEFTLDRIKR